MAIGKAHKNWQFAGQEAPKVKPILTAHEETNAPGQMKLLDYGAKKNEKIVKRRY